jgi:RHS repeat-associated protein
VYAYDPAGNRLQKTLPNGIAVDYSYDALDRLMAIVHSNGGTTLASYIYALGPAGNRLAVTEVDGSSIEWTYDNAYRLIGERRLDSGGSTVSETAFTYDAAGNRLSMTVDGVTTVYAYNALDQLLSAGSAAFTYDAMGNLVQVVDGLETTTYAFDALDRLTGATLADGTALSYAYDADGRRVQQEVAGSITNFIWDEASPYGDVVLETDAGGATLAAYVLGGTELLSQNRGGVPSYYLHDGQGSVRALTSPAGGITDMYSYTAYGELFAQTGTDTNPYLYTGQQFDAMSGLYSLRARFYDPTLGRFLSRDLAGAAVDNSGERNRYGYAAANPVNAVDPQGRDAFYEYSQENQQSAEEAKAAEPVGQTTADAVGVETAGFQRIEAQSLYQQYIRGSSWARDLPGTLRGRPPVTVAKGIYQGADGQVHTILATNEFYGAPGKVLEQGVRGGLRQFAAEQGWVFRGGTWTGQTDASALHAEEVIVRYVESIAGNLPENTRVVVGIANDICTGCQPLGIVRFGAIIRELANGVRIILLGTGLE